MFRQLGFKLFAGILLVNILISGTIYWTMSRSIDSSFGDYIRNRQQESVTSLAEELVSQWRSHGHSWEFLEGRRGLWLRLLRQHRNGGQTASASLFDPPGEGQPPLPPELDDPRRFSLLNEQGRAIFEAQRRQDIPLNYYTLAFQGQPIGSLGYPAVEKIIGSIDRAFVRRQLRSLGIIMSGTFLASIVLSAGLAWWIGRRTRRMAAFTRQLMKGHFDIRLTSRGKDELASLSHDLNSLAMTLEHNQEARQRWVADIAHELRTPLAILKGELEAMADGIRKANTETIGSLIQEVDQLNHLVEDLRLLAQSDAHTLASTLQPLDLGEHLEQRLEEARHRMELGGIQLMHEISFGLVIRGDDHRLRQIWNNLLDNTLFYTDAPGLMKVTLERHDRHALVRWEDSSPGVPEASLDKLTERLYRVDASRNRRHGGSGLGLAIVSAMSTLHGASLTASLSALGGLEWRLSFPLYSDGNS